MTEEISFFERKRPWSRYKDGILDYYLKPYLSKVATLNNPIAVVDFFAGPGGFQDGEPGSPIIILSHLQREADRGIEVRGFFVEKNPVLYSRLQKTIRPYTAIATALPGDFHTHVDLISDLARTHTVFLYVDPLRPTQLKFDDLATIYSALPQGQSVEVLVNFMSTSFVRAVQGLRGRCDDASSFRYLAAKEGWNVIAGGEYWQEPILSDELRQRDRIDVVARGYADAMKKWYRWILHYPIREKYEDEQPKYHLMFGSRSHHAIDLMNRAMVTARRQFVGARFQEGCLFDMRPEKEVPDSGDMRKLILETSEGIGRTRWEWLRAHSTIREPCLYTDSELNGAIKSAIRSGVIRSNCSGERVAEKADVWVN